MKEFSCNCECGSNCCEYLILDKTFPKNEKLDIKYLTLRGIEIKEIMQEQDKKVYFKIPIKCEWFDSQCTHYDDRPISCRVGHGNNKPFAIEGCSYGNAVPIL